MLGAVFAKVGLVLREVFVLPNDRRLPAVQVLLFTAIVLAAGTVAAVTALSYVAGSAQTRGGGTAIEPYPLGVVTVVVAVLAVWAVVLRRAPADFTRWTTVPAALACLAGGVSMVYFSRGDLGLSQLTLFLPVVSLAYAAKRAVAYAATAFATFGEGLLAMGRLPAEHQYSEIVSFAVVMFGTTYVVTRLRTRHDEARARLADLRDIDPLTGGYSRQYFDRVVQQLVDEPPPGGLGVVMADIDNFRGINESYGHAVGDNAVTEMAELCAKVAGLDGVSGRIGGDEFIVLLPGADEHATAHIAFRLRDAIRGSSVRMVGHQTQRLTMTASVGYSHWPSQVRGVEQVYVAAEGALVEAKKKGRDQVACAPAGERSPPVDP